MRRQKFVQGFHSGGRERGRLCAIGDECISRECSRPACIGHDGEARTRWPRLLRQNLSHVEKLFDPGHAQHANAPKGGVKHGVAARQRAGVRSSSFRRGIRAAHLQNDDWLCERNFARRRKKSPRQAG